MTETTPDHSPAPETAWAIFVDFDGTITDLDTFDVLVRYFAGPEAWHDTERGLDDGTVSLRDVLSLQASYVRGSLDDVAAILRREIAVDPTFSPFVRAMRARGSDVTILSSGLEPIVRGRLADIGLADLDVIANDVDPDPTGWRIRFRDPVDNGTDKAAVLRAASARGVATIFIGDGRSDYGAALVANRCFAKRGLPLERYLRSKGKSYEAFASFAEIERSLTAIPHRG